VGLNFLKCSFLRLLNPQSVEVNIWVINIIFATVIVKIFLGIITQIVAFGKDVALLKTDAMHHYSDAVTSLIVAIGLFLVRKGLVVVDSLLAAAVALVIIFWAVKSGRNFIDNLIGRRASGEIYQQIKTIATSFDKVKGVHGIQVHCYGKNRLISLHVEMDSKLLLEQAHKVADSIEKKIKTERLGKCVVHVDAT